MMYEKRQKLFDYTILWNNKENFMNYIYVTYCTHTILIKQNNVNSNIINKKFIIIQTTS